MRVRMLDTENKRDVRSFIDFPKKLYRKCAQWTPPLDSEMLLNLNRQKHPFYKHSQADFFVVESEGQILGRIAVLKNRNYCDYHKDEVGFFCYYDVVEDPQASALLFDQAMLWYRQHNVRLILGTKGFLRTFGLGLLVEGFEYPAVVGMAYNYPYYDRFVKASGFEKETDHISGYYSASRDELPEKIQHVAERVRQRGGYEIKTFDNADEMRSWIPKVKIVHDEAFGTKDGFYPSNGEEFAMIGESLIQVSEPGLMKLVMKGDEVAGFVMSYPDFSEGLRKSGGKIFPLGWYFIPKAFRQSHTLLVNGVGFTPKYQGLGGNIFLYSEIEKTVRNSRFTRIEVIQVDEHNSNSFSDQEHIGVTWYKRHRSYHKIITE